MSRLTDVITLLYEMQKADVKALENALLEARKRAWTLALNEKAREYGCDQGGAKAPKKDDLRELRSMSRKDAESIAKTWNRDVRREVERLYAANHKGNRFYYTSNLEKWAAGRAAWKNDQIALQVEHTTRFYAQQRFREANGVKNARFLFSGSPPVCKVCMGHFAAGAVPDSYVRRNPAPVHIGCPHEWREIVTQPIPCDSMWKG